MKAFVKVQMVVEVDLPEGMMDVRYESLSNETAVEEQAARDIIRGSVLRTRKIAILAVRNRMTWRACNRWMHDYLIQEPE